VCRGGGCWHESEAEYRRAPWLQTPALRGIYKEERRGERKGRRGDETHGSPFLPTPPLSPRDRERRGERKGRRGDETHGSPFLPTPPLSPRDRERRGERKGRRGDETHGSPFLPTPPLSPRDRERSSGSRGSGEACFDNKHTFSVIYVQLRLANHI
jgi:hypothetical protein